jgi:DsbC/DsbD-like thiol-disulfide interchange protein
VDVLARFAATHGITFPLLSDVGSRVIRELGMLDEQVYEHHAAFGITDRQDRFWGVPYPGEFLLDERGIVTQKRFQKNYRERETSHIVLEQGFGMEASSHGPEARGEAGGVAVRAFLDAERYRIYQRLRVHVEVVVPSGWHVYGLPIPEGYVPLSVSVVPIEGLEVGEPVLPTPHPFRVEGLEEQFFVYDGKVSVAVPILFTKNVSDQTLHVEVRFQACSSDQCQRPNGVRLDLRIQAEKHVDWHT